MQILLILFICQISNECVDDLLVIADELLLPGLKRLCGNAYSKLLSVDTVMATIRLARLFELIKLEHQCIRFIGDHLEEVRLTVFFYTDG